MGIELGLMAAGTALSAYNKKKAADGAEGATRRGLEQQQIDHDRAMHAVKGSIGYLQSSNPDAARAQVSSDFLDTLRANAGNADAGTPVVHAANPRYAEAVHAANAAADAHTSKVSGFIASLMAAAKQRTAENNNAQDAALRVSGIQQDAGQDAFNSGLAIDKAGQPDPWMSLGASILTNAGTSGVFAPKATLPPRPIASANGGPDPLAGGASPTGNTPWNPWATTH